MVGILSILGIAIALVGAGMLVAPGVTIAVLRLLGSRRPPHPASRAAAWGLVILGLVVTALARAVR